MVIKRIRVSQNSCAESVSELMWTLAVTPALRESYHFILFALFLSHDCFGLEVNQSRIPLWRSLTKMRD